MSKKKTPVALLELATPTAALEAQEAMYERFAGDTTFMSLVKGVFDGIPENQLLPYLAFGDHVESPWETFGHDNADVEMLMHVYTYGPGDTECYQILAEIKRLLRQPPNGSKLVMPHYLQSQLRLQAASILTDPTDNISRHMVIRYRLLAYEVS